mmetsp:Transcript_46258/g.93372  ORF Transcript_46258/g.93372 Transcript_46258/m.93372 type:complete len:204 (-) Transcript_46258:132-743(-)
MQSLLLLLASYGIFCNSLHLVPPGRAVNAVWVTRRGWVVRASSTLLTLEFLGGIFTPPASAACVPGDTDLDCLGYYKEYGLLTEKRGTRTMSSKEASRLLVKYLDTIKSWTKPIKERDFETIGTSMLELTPRVKELGEAVCATRDGPCEDVATAAFSSLFDLEAAVSLAYRESRPTLAAQAALMEAHRSAVFRVSAFVSYLKS